MMFYVMKTEGKKSLLAIFLFTVCLFFPKTALAATAYLTSDYETVAIGDTIMVSVAMDTSDKNPNTVEGDILIKSGAENIVIQDFSLAGSVLTNWLKTPSFEEGTKISFMGGVPGGFHQKSGLLFKIIFLAKTEGQVVFVPANIKAYDNDGKATALNVSDTPLTITIGKEKGGQKNQWLEVVSKDNEPPENLSVAIGRDSSVFEGKKFMTISAVDSQSGIDRFEVAEGNQPAVRTGETYVLRDQSESSPIAVTVYDKAGNKSKILLHPDGRGVALLAGVAIVSILLALGYVVFKRFALLKKKNVPKV